MKSFTNYGLKISLVFMVICFGYEHIDAAVYDATPSNYLSKVSSLKPGDTLQLAAGTYTERLSIHSLNGTKESPIIITGASNHTTIFNANSSGNTVSIKDSSYIIIKNLKLDGKNYAVDGVKAESTSAWAHNITLENLHIVNHGNNRLTSGINTKCTAWDWVIRNCIIEQAGTGMYLGNSDGRAPFVNGIIEYNLIKDSIGYNMQIKHQLDNLRTISGMTLNGKTTIRYNVFSKGSNSSTGSDARPSLLVGSFPPNGHGSEDVYLIYGNFFYQNPVEALFQGTGSIAFYNNLCINTHQTSYPGINIKKHNNFAPRDITIFSNTIVVNSDGIKFTEVDPQYQQLVIGNAVFAPTPILNAPSQQDNITDSYNKAGDYLINPSAAISSLDLFPKINKLKGSPITTDNLSKFDNYNLDFNGEIRNWEFRGAYSGEGNNPGWTLKLERRPIELKGDIDGNGIINLSDVIIGLKILTQSTVSSFNTGFISKVNGSNKIAMEDIIYSLRYAAGYY